MGPTFCTMVTNIHVLKMMNLFTNEQANGVSIFLFNIPFKHLYAHDYKKSLIFLYIKQWPCMKGCKWKNWDPCIMNVQSESNVPLHPKKEMVWWRFCIYNSNLWSSSIKLSSMHFVQYLHWKQCSLFMVEIIFFNPNIFTILSLGYYICFRLVDFHAML